MEPEEDRRVDPEPSAGELELLDAQCTEVVDRSHRWMRFAGLAVGRAHERHAHAAFAQVSEDSTVKDFVVGMGEDDQQ